MCLNHRVLVTNNNSAISSRIAPANASADNWAGNPFWNCFFLRKAIQLFLLCQMLAVTINYSSRFISSTALARLQCCLLHKTNKRELCLPDFNLKSKRIAQGLNCSQLSSNKISNWNLRNCSGKFWKQHHNFANIFASLNALRAPKSSIMLQRSSTEIFLSIGKL
jgi:hypothetical protein